MKLALKSLTLTLTLAWLPAASEATAARRPPHRTRVLRTWQDSVKVGGSDVARRVEIVFDYTAGVAREIARDASGAVISNRILRNAPRPSAEEIAAAEDLVRADPELGPMMARTKAIVDGGFLLQEAPRRACGPGTRCIQLLLLSENRLGGLRRVVVDLTRQTLAYRAYVPSPGKGAQK